MQRALGVVEVVFQPLDLFAELIAVAPIAVAIPIRTLVLSPQPLDLSTLSLDLALLPFQLGDQLITRRRAPFREHAPVMARLKNLYKYKRVDRGRRRRSSAAVTR